jgi:hypothetical protein
MPHVINESEFGRRYYTGLNLQNAPKEVRHAALGTCYQYDMTSAVYAIKLNFASQITDEKFTYTGEYVERGGILKKSIRERLAHLCFEPTQEHYQFESRVDVIKSAMTAIGFGAKKTSTGYYVNNTYTLGSLSEIFTYTINNKKIPYTKLVNGEKINSIELFLQDEWVSNFMREQEIMTNLLNNYIIENKVVTKQSHPYLVDKRNAFNKNKLISWFFQQTERQIMNRVIDYAESKGSHVLLRVHDAIYVDKKLNLQELYELLENEFTDRELTNRYGKVFGFGETQINGYTFSTENESDIDEHFNQLIKDTLGVDVPDVQQIKHQAPKQTTFNYQDFYDSQCDYGQTEYDPENDPYVESMTYEERLNHYRIVGYKPQDNIPEAIKKVMLTN